MSTRKLCILLLFVLLPPGCAPVTIPPDALVLVNGTLIDGTGSDPRTDAVLIIQEERILAVGTNEEIKIPPGTNVIDLEGDTILPGFINAHVHFAFNEENLKAWAYGGVTTVRDEGIVSSKTLDNLMEWRDEARQNPQYARLI